MAILYILWPFGLFYSHFVYFVAVGYILWLFDISFAVLVCCTKKNLATLRVTRGPIKSFCRDEHESG
jgi:hypothetical protein